MPTVKVVANPSKGDGMPESVQETVRTHLDHGRACLDKGKYDDAIADYDKAIEINPNVAIAYINRSLAYARSAHRRTSPLTNEGLSTGTLVWYTLGIGEVRKPPQNGRLRLVVGRRC
jgi:tetratricopeptide (TPR) repeat protein